MGLVSRSSRATGWHTVTRGRITSLWHISYGILVMAYWLWHISYHGDTQSDHVATPQSGLSVVYRAPWSSLTAYRGGTGVPARVSKPASTERAFQQVPWLGPIRWRCMSMHMSMHMPMHTSVHMSTTNVCAHVHTRVCVRARSHVRTRVCAHIYAHVHTHVCTHVFTQAGARRHVVGSRLGR